MDWIEQFFHDRWTAGTVPSKLSTSRSRSSRLWGWSSAVASPNGLAAVDASPEAAAQPQP